MATTKTPEKLADLYKPTELEKTKRDYVYDRYHAMRDNPKRQQAETVWRKGREQWEALRHARSEDEWQSNHYVPVTTAVVETAMSEIIDQSPKPMILPRGSEDIPKATIMEHIFEYTWDISGSDLEEEDVLHDTLVCGTGIAQEFYWKDVRKIKTGLKKGSKQEYDTEDKADYEDCYMEGVRLEDFFVDELARGFSGPYRARDAIRRYIMDIEAFKQFFCGEVWDPLGNAKFVRPGGDTNYYEKYGPPQGIDHSKQVEVLWYWSIAPEDLLCIVANDVVVVMGPNPYKHKQLPFARAVDIKRTHEFYGKGEAELLESIQDELNTLRRMVIDRNHLDIDKMFYGPSRINLSDEDLIARPHGFIPSDEEIHPVEYNDVPRSVEISLSHLEDDSTVVTGINPRSQALPTTGTATEAAILKESTLKRIRLKVRRFEREFLTRIATLRVSNIIQYYSQPRLEEIIGKQGTQEYEKQINELRAKGLLEETPDGTVYEKKYREIPLMGKEFTTGADGSPMIQDSQSSITFFQLNPDYFLPSKSGYNIKITAGSTLPISKSLMQTKYQEAYDRLSVVALKVPNTYSIKKLGDMLLRINDINPTDVSVDQPIQQEADQRAQMMVELASMENKLMMQNKAIAPSGTPNVGMIHTQVHVEFTSSPEFQALTSNDPRVQLMIDHITGEVAAQGQRQGSVPGGSPAGAPGQDQINGLGAQPQAPDQASGGANTMMNDLNPSLIQGGGQVAPAV